MEPAPGADTNSVVKPDKMGIDHVEHGTAGELTEQDLYRLSSRKLSLPISQLSADEIEVELHHRHGTLFTASAHVITAIIGAGVQRLRCPGPLGGALVLGANCMEASLKTGLHTVSLLCAVRPSQVCWASQVPSPGWVGRRACSASAVSRTTLCTHVWLSGLQANWLAACLLPVSAVFDTACCEPHVHSLAGPAAFFCVTMLVSMLLTKTYDVNGHKHRRYIDAVQGILVRWLPVSCPAGCAHNVVCQLGGHISAAGPTAPI